MSDVIEIDAEVYEPDYLTIEPSESVGGDDVAAGYGYLPDKPSINGVTLVGNKTTADLGLIDDVPIFTPVAGATPAVAGLVPSTGGHTTTDDIAVLTDEGWESLDSTLDTSSKLPPKSYAVADYVNSHAVKDVKVNNVSVVASGVANINNFRGGSPSSPSNHEGLVPKPPAIGETGQFHILTDNGWKEAYPQPDSTIPWANKYSPAFTGTPTAPTATHGTNTTQIATTAFVQDAVSGASGAGAFIAELGITPYADVKAAYDNGEAIICISADVGYAWVYQLAFFDDENSIFYFASSTASGCLWAGVASDDGWDDGEFEYASTDLATALRDGLMSSADKVKLDGIESGAEANVQADWSEADSSSDAYINNKPSIPANTSDLINDSGFITDAGVTSVNGNSGAVTVVEGLAPLIGTTDNVTPAQVATALSEGRDICISTPYMFNGVVLTLKFTSWNRATDVAYGGAAIDVVISQTIAKFYGVFYLFELVGGTMDGSALPWEIHTSTVVNDDELMGAISTATVATEAKIDGVHSNLFYGTVDNTSTATAFTATIPNFPDGYTDGLTVILKNGVVTSASGFTININGIGAKQAYSNMAAATAETTLFNINYTMMFIYDSTRVDGGGWILYRGYNANDNTIGYQVRTNTMSLPMKSAMYRYRILFTSADRNGYVPATNSTSTNATSSRTVCQDPIDPFGDIRYYSSTTSVSAGSRPSVTTLWQQYGVTLGYSFNRTGAALTLTPWKPVYVKCAPQANGSAIIDSTTPYVQDLPSTEDGKIYIFLGVATSATAMELMLHHPVYEYRSGMIRPYTNAFPNVTSADEGKFLRVNSSGKWVAEAVTSAESEAY